MLKRTVMATTTPDSVSGCRVWCLRISVAVCRLFFCGLSLGFAGALTGFVVRLVSSPRCFLACAIHGFLCFSDYGLAGFFRFLAYGLGGLFCFPANR
jgi:hypothetical protein